jgi:hypothetical protein
MSAKLKSEVTYVRDLIEAGFDGAASAWKHNPGPVFKPVCPAGLWIPAALGAGVGVLGACLNKERRSGQRMAAYVLAGTAIGLSAGLVWLSRAATRGMVAGARRNVDTVRDTRWLNKHPIAYA